MDKDQLLTTVKQICSEKNISLESVIETIEAALAAAYRKDFGEKTQNIKVEFDMETGKSEVFDVKEVVEDFPEEEEEEGEEKEEKISDKESEEEDEGPKFNPKTQIQISDAKEIKKSYKIGDIIKTQLEVPEDYGRMAAQTAKQVIIQKLREAERQVLFKEFSAKEGELIIGIVQRREGSRILIDMGNVTAVMPLEEQVRGEHYNPGDRVRVLILSVNETTKGPEVIVTRAHEEMLKKLFEIEIPEIAAGTVVIKSVAREPGSRSKIAVMSEDDNIDPIGSCVGQRGSRIQTIINELGGEKIDIIEWDEDPMKFIEHAILPAKADLIDLNEEEKSAIIHVASDQLSLAIGKSGQNVRLAVKLTGWNINIQETGAAEKKVEIEESSEDESTEESGEDMSEGAEPEEEKIDKEK